MNERDFQKMKEDFAMKIDSDAFKTALKSILNEFGITEGEYKTSVLFDNNLNKLCLLVDIAPIGIHDADLTARIIRDVKPPVIFYTYGKQDETGGAMGHLTIPTDNDEIRLTVDVYIDGYACTIWSGAGPESSGYKDIHDVTYDPVGGSGRFELTQS